MAVFSPEGNPMKCPAFMRMVPRVQVSGLTMVEVLVVMAIVILLAALLLPVGKKMIELSKSTQCISNLKSIYMASMTHAQDHNMEIPCSYVNPNTGHCWYQALAGDPKTGSLPAPVDIFLWNMGQTKRVVLPRQPRETDISKWPDWRWNIRVDQLRDQ